MGRGEESEMMHKAGTSVRGIRPEILAARMIASPIWKRHGQQLVITSSTDGGHGEGSSHYRGEAEDYRTHYFDPLSVQGVADELQNALGDEYQVIVEKTHVHVQWKPL